MFDLFEKIDEINIKYRYKPALHDNNSLLIIFSGFGKNGGVTYDFRNALNSSSSAIIWIEDSLEDNISYYLGRGISEKIQSIVFEFICRKIKELNVIKENCIIMGCSKGGSAALYYGIKFNFNNIIMTVPQFKIYSYISGQIPIWKGHPNVVNHMIKQEGDKARLDSIIIDAIKADKLLNKNIYLITSTKDDQFYGQIDPFVELFDKYENFNLLLSESILVKKHTDVTKYNKSVVVGLLSLLEKNIYPHIGYVKYRGRNENEKLLNIEPKLFLETSNLFFKDNNFFIEGVGFFEGMSCGKWEDINYTLYLENNQKIEIIPLAKTNKKTTTERFSGQSRVNYDKANFCTHRHKGLDLQGISEGIYKLKIKVKNILYEKKQTVYFEGLQTFYSQNRNFCIYANNGEVFLKVDKSIDIQIKNEYVLEIKSRFGKAVKSWLYSQNTIANHFNVKGFVFVLDIIFLDSEKLRISLLSKDKIYNSLVLSFMIKNFISDNEDKMQVDFLIGEGLIEKILEILEDFIFYVNKNLNEIDFYNNLNYSNSQIILKRRNKKKKVVGFLVSDHRKWNLDDFYNLLKVSEDFVPKIILLKEKIILDKNDERYQDQLRRFKNIDEGLLEKENCSNKEFENKVLSEVDIIFYQQPWDGMAYWMRKFHNKILACYVPYSFIMLDMRLDYSIQDFHKYIWKYYAQSPHHIKTYLKYEPYHSSKITVIGYPKMDAYLVNSKVKPFLEKFGADSRKKIIYAPHHSFKGSHLQIATFDWNGSFFQERRDSDDALWCFKPHGRFKYSVINSGILSEDEANKYIEEWSVSKNSFIYDSGEYFDLFKDSDVMITDCSSFLAEYFPTGKPIIWLKSSISKVEFNNFGKYISKGFYVVENLMELEKVYNRVVLGGDDDLVEIRQKIITEIFSEKEFSSEKLINDLRLALQ